MPCDMETVLYLDGVILPTASSVRLKNVSNHSLFFKFTMNYLIVGIPSNTVSIWLLKEKDIKYFKSVNKVVQMFLLTL